MKSNSPTPSAAAPAENGAAPSVWRSKGARVSRWPMLADFRSRSFHLRQHRPGSRARFSLLRGVALGLMMAGQLALQPAAGGTITGTVHAEGKPGAEAGSAGGDAYGSRKYKFIERVDYAAMHDFVVSIEGLTVTNNGDTKVMTVTTVKAVAQERATFSPHILPVLAGTTVEWPNNDEIYHNVFSDSDAKPFDLDLYKGNPPDKRVTFDKPGKVDVFCSIHADMHCVVLVMPNPYFAVTDSNNHYAIHNVPAGTYKLKVWHERMPAGIYDITVPADGEVQTNLTLTIKNLPQI